MDGMALAVNLPLLLLLPDDIKYYLGPKWVKSGHSGFYPILLLLMPSLQSCTSAIIAVAEGK